MMREEYDFHFDSSIVTLSQEVIDYAQKDQTNLLRLLSVIFHELNSLNGHGNKRIKLELTPFISTEWEDL